MIDIRMVREDPGAVQAALARRGGAAEAVDRRVALDAAHRARLGEQEALRATVKALSRQVGEAKLARLGARAREIADRFPVPGLPEA